jgi:putative transposase
VIRFIAEHKDNQVPGPDGGAGLRWGVEPMCAVLSEHGVPISPSTYYEWINKHPTKRQLRDAELVEIITAQRADKKTGKFVQTLGSRKLWIRLRGQGHDVARCTVERIMREQGWEGARYGSRHKTTIQDDAHPRYPDLVDRNFHARRRIVLGLLTLRMCRPGQGSSMSRSSSTPSAAESSAGVRRSR